MKTLIFATHNNNKVLEIRSLMPRGMDVVSLEEAGFHEEIPEPHDTLEDNAREKSLTIYRLTGRDCFSEDTGLEVAALDGEPGVLSARYAGLRKLASDNVKKLLRNMEGISDRRARFRTVISLYLQGAEYQFDGVCEGRIAESASGEEGFGYDPVFIPDGETRTFAEMGLGEKNRFSHRAKAVAKLIAFLHRTAKP
jgi:XTP/dITP diphosphohydrolase